MPVVSKDAYKRDFERRLRLNRQILEKAYWYLPVDDVGHEEFMPVGRGDKSSSFCGVHLSYSVCDNVEGHKGKFLNGVDCTGKVIVRHNHMWCNKSACPICFIRGWSVNRARTVDGRLAEGVKRGFGEVEHFTVSVPVADRNLPESVLRKKCRDALRNRGVSGSCMIFHGYRIDRERHVLVWSVHYHGLGFIEGGYECRGCTKVSCAGCDGFEARTRREFEKDGCIVVVHAKRETVFGTAWYLLNHATIRLGVKRFHSLVWWGNCAKRKFKSAKAKTNIVCPLCEEEMVKSMYMGKRRIVKDIGHPDYVAVFPFERLDENGELNWIPIRGSRGGGFG